MRSRRGSASRRTAPTSWSCATASSPARSKEPILGRATKLATLIELTESFDLDDIDTMVAGDGANDLGMIQNAGLGVAYHAKPAVAAAAAARIDYRRSHRAACMRRGIDARNLWGNECRRSCDGDPTARSLYSNERGEPPTCPCAGPDDCAKHEILAAHDLVQSRVNAGFPRQHRNRSYYPSPEIAARSRSKANGIEHFGN